MMDLYSFRLGRMGKTMGEALKNQSDTIMDKTWWRDIQSKECYLYDYWHDSDIFPELKKLPYEGKTPVDAKYVTISSNTTSKDQCDVHLQFRPKFTCPFDLENDYSLDTYLYPETFPIGLYIDIPNQDGVYEKWMIVLDNKDLQFKTYIILPCNYKFRWIRDGVKYRMWGCLRSQSSYNSGLWLDCVKHIVRCIWKQYSVFL